MNQLWAILPVKPFGEGKSRLAEQLHSAERAALSKELLTRVIQTIQAAEVCAESLVISRDNNVLGYAESLGARTLLEAPILLGRNGLSEITPSAATPNEADPNETGSHKNKPNEDKLNAALGQASDEAVKKGADAILVLPADLPLIRPEDIIRLAEAGHNGPRVVIAPSTDSGTNALLLNPPRSINFAFGIRSFKHHQDLAQRKGIPLHIIHSSTLAFDVDRPADLNALARLATT